MNKKILGLAILLGILGLNQMGLAQLPTGGGDFVTLVSNFFKILVGLIAIIAVVFIILGAFQFFTAAGDPEKASRAKQQIIYAVIGLFIAVAAWALVNWLVKNFGGTQPF
jgi:protein-S-isoprenylcysteine O-methyltransferase Ste14